MFTASAATVVKQWPAEELAVAYAPALRTTHLISAASARILHRLASRPSSLQELVEVWVGPDDDAPTDAEALMQSLREALASLESAELVASSR